MCMGMYSVIWKGNSATGGVGAGNGDERERDVHGEEEAGDFVAEASRGARDENDGIGASGHCVLFSRGRGGGSWLAAIGCNRWFMPAASSVGWDCVFPTGDNTIIYVLTGRFSLLLLLCCWKWWKLVGRITGGHSCIVFVL